MAEALLEIATFVRDRRKRLVISIVPTSMPSGIGVEINNYTDDCVPMLGWTWEDPQVNATGASLAIAWINFKREASING